MSTIYGHFAEAISTGLINAIDVLPIEEQQYSEIINAFELFSDQSTGSLKPVYEALEGSYDYGILKCVFATLNLTQT